MSFLSKIMKPIVRGQAPVSKRNMGGLEPILRTGSGQGIRPLGARPDLPQSDRQSFFGKMIDRPALPISPTLPSIRPPQVPAPVIPTMPSLGLPDLSALQNISPAVKDAVQQSLATGEPILSPERVQEMIDQPPVAPPPLPPKRIPDQIRIGDRPIPRPSIGGFGGGITDDRAINSLEGPDLRRPKPIPPQDFGFGPGIRPTEIRGPDGRIIAGSAGVTPPARTPLSEREDIFGAGKRYDPSNLPEGFSFEDNSGMMRTTVMPPPGFVYAYGPDGERRAVPSGEPGAAEMRDQGAARDQAFLDFQKTNPGEVFFGGLTPPPTTPPQYSNMIAELPPERIAEMGDPIPATDPVTPPASTTVAANQPPVAPPAPTQPPATTTDGVGTAPAAPAPTTTTAPPQVPGGTPFAAGVTQVQSGLDPLSEQLLFGVGGRGGFIPGAMRAAEKVFYDEQGQPVVIEEQVAGFSPDQLAAMQMQRQAVGMQDPYLQQAAGAYGAGTQALEEGLQRGRTAAIGALGATRRGVGSLQRGLGESADILRGTIGGYDPSMTERFYDPYEDKVVQQTIKDIMEQGAKADIGARAGDIARGGESAFGSRARLGAGERQEALGRGLAEAVSGIRSQGFREAQQTGLGEFARQKAAERAASSGLAGLAGQGFGGAQALAGALTGLGGTEQQIGQQRYSGQFGLGSSLQGLGAQAAGASASDIAALYGMGTQQQGQAQQMLDAQRRNLQQRQMTPLLQYQALAPFVSMAPAGQFQTTTQFAPKPSAMQSGLSTGLAAFGALGKLYGGSK